MKILFGPWENYQGNKDLHIRNVVGKPAITYHGKPAPIKYLFISLNVSGSYNNSKFYGNVYIDELTSFGSVTRGIFPYYSDDLNHLKGLLEEALDYLGDHDFVFLDKEKYDSLMVLL